LKTAIAGIVEQSLGNINDGIVKRAATESLAQVAMQNPPQRTNSVSVYDNSGYRETYTGAGPTDPALITSPPTYPSMPVGSTHPYNLGNPMPVPQQTSTTYDHPTYNTDDSGLTTTHVVALAAASGGTSQPGDGYGYPQNTHVHSANGDQSAYSANGYSQQPQQDWRQWTRTYMQPQPLSQPGEYLNTATTLMALGGRDGGSQDPGHQSQGHLDNSGVPSHHVHWPELAYPNAANGHGHMGHQ
jgi:hypothetical protein